MSRQDELGNKDRHIQSNQKQIGGSNFANQAFAFWDRFAVCLFSLELHQNKTILPSP